MTEITVAMADSQTSSPAAILIVEDDCDSCEMLVLMVGKMFPTLLTHCAGDGKTGWELFQQHLPDIVITDLSMPEMDGMELARLIRSRRPDTRLVAISADLERAAHKSCCFDRQVFDSYLAKPFQFRDLMAVIECAVPMAAAPTVT